jgi:hypothetical protein
VIITFLNTTCFSDELGRATIICTICYREKNIEKNIAISIVCVHTSGHARIDSQSHVCA